MPMSTEEARAFLDGALNDLKAHRAICTQGQRDPTGAELRYVMNGAGVCRIQIWWTRIPSPVIGPECLWEEVEMTSSISQSAGAGDMVRELGAQLQIEVSKREAVISKGRAASTVPMFSFHPQRFRALHPMGPAVTRMAYGMQQTWHAFTLEAQQALGQVMLDTQLVEGIRLRRKLALPDPGGRLQGKAMTLAQFFLAFCISGRQIFQFPPSLLEMFAKVDVDDIPLDLILFPYDAMYFSFGARSDLRPQEGWCADGVYTFVHRGEDEKEVTHVHFALTCVPDDPEAYTHLGEIPEPCFVVALGPEHLKLGVGEACDLFMSEKINDLRQQIAGNTDFAREFSNEHPGGTNVQSRAAALEYEQLPALERCWKGMLKLVVNALAYLSAYPDDVDKGWPSNTPDSVLTKLTSEKAKVRQKAGSELAALGFTPVQLCGRSFAPRRGGYGDGQGSDAGPTWVKGHWTRQPWGPRHSLRRLQLILPYVRNRDSETDPSELGHVYQCHPKGATNGIAHKHPPIDKPAPPPKT